MTFSSIPSTYTDLLIKASARNTAATGSYFRINLNGATTNGTDRYLLGSGSAASSGSESFAGYGEVCTTGDTASTFASTDIYIPNYALSTAYKSISIDTVRENNATAANSDLVAALWSQNTAVTSIDLVVAANFFAANTTASLYGISKS
jgi:hypothetical protein